MYSKHGEQHSRVFNIWSTDEPGSGDVTPEPDFDVGELSSTGRQVEVALGGAVQLQCPAGESLFPFFQIYLGPLYFAFNYLHTKLKLSWQVYLTQHNLYFRIYSQSWMKTIYFVDIILFILIKIHFEWIEKTFIQKCAPI